MFFDKKGFVNKKSVKTKRSHDLLSKHLTQLSSIDSTISQPFAEKAMMQTRCQTEHQRLLALFKEEQQTVNDKSKERQSRKVVVKAPSVELATSSGFQFGDRREWEVKVASQPNNIPFVMTEK